MSLQAGKTQGYENERVQRLAQAAGYTGDQLLPVPVHIMQLIGGKHNTAVLSEPVLLLCICFIFFCPCVPHNMNVTLSNPVEILACVYSVTRTVHGSFSMQIFFQIAWTFIYCFCDDSDNELTTE